MSFVEEPEAILLLAHGTPDVLSEMAEYLGKVTGGRPMPMAVVEELQHRYAETGLREEPLAEGPPLTKWTLKQGRMLKDKLGMPVYVGMRNWHPYIGDVVERMRADGVRRFRAVCLAPQNSRTSVGLYRSAARKASGGMEMEFVAGWSEDPMLARGFALELWPVWAQACATLGKRVPVLFSAHSVPCRTIMAGAVGIGLSTSARLGAQVPMDGIQDYGAVRTPDPYPVECKATAAAIANALLPLGMTEKDWYFAFQSQGIAGAPWIGPAVEETLKALAEEGHRGVVMQPVGFLCDHVEVLYDIDISFKETARQLGMQLWRAPSLNDSPVLIQALAEVATGRFAAQVDEVPVLA